MKHKTVFAVFILVLLLVVFSFGVYEYSQSGYLRVEAEQHWETYGVGGTCIPATHNLFVADVDGDGVLEIITGGYTYNLANGTRASPAAPLKIWSWNGQNLTLEKSYNWSTSGNAIIICVFAGDANGDGETEIITAGGITNATGNYAQLRIWRWDGETLALKTSCEQALYRFSISSVFIKDVDADGTPEILTCGRSYGADASSKAQLSVWHWDGDSLVLNETVEWCATSEASANSVYASDVNDDGVIEILTGGFDNDLNNSAGQLKIWHWNGAELSSVANEEWRLKEEGYGLTISGGVMGNTLVNNLKVGDVNGDGVSEIVTGGFAYDGEKIKAQLRIWNCSGQTLLLEKSHEWATKDISEVKSISLNDVDGDGRMEIVTSGVTAAQGSFATNATDKELAQLRVWSWDGVTLTLEQSQDWTIGEGVCAWNVATGDVDKDGTVEIITVGCMYISNMCDPDMRIWSISKGFSPSTFPLSLECVISTVALVATITLASMYLLAERVSKIKIRL
jgi:hypothetical protein